MKIFEVTADQIKRLTDIQIVELLRRLLNSELRKNSISLIAGVAPAQITIPDGGEDGRVTWHNGPARTDFIPSRYAIFQCKKSVSSPAQLKKEVWSKSSQGTGKARELNAAISETLKNRGSYLVVTGSPIVGIKVNHHIQAIKDGVREAGGNPDDFSSIEILEANKLASWASSHPSVALWLNSTLRDLHLHGYRDYDDWSTDAELSETLFQCSTEARFLLKGAPIRKWRRDEDDFKELQSMDLLQDNTEKYFQNYGRAIRVVGPSGYGKTRFIHELFRTSGKGESDFLDVKQVIYAQYEDVRTSIVNVAREISQSGSRCVLIVDDCPDEIHTRLWSAMDRGTSNSALITIGMEAKSTASEKNLIIELQEASAELIEGISKDVAGVDRHRDTSFVRELAQGFPRMAVLASRATIDGDQELASVEALVDRIVWGDDFPDDEALFALQTLSLFTVLGVENEVSAELAEIAKFIDKSPQYLFRTFKKFQGRGIVSRTGDFAEVQPIPLAMRLANAWLASMPDGTLERLFRETSPELQLRIAGRLRWVSWSREVSIAANRLLEELIPNLTYLNSEHGSKLLDRFVHMAPDRVMEHLNSILRPLTIDELKDFTAGRRHTVRALERLVFRKETFTDAATLLLRLGAAENERWSNNATGQFQSLFKLNLSGTEANPAMKLAVLDAEMRSDDLRVRKICVDALGKMLTTRHFSRSAGRERIGTSEPLSDWYPKTYGEIYDYYRSALHRLKTIALSNDDPLQVDALNHIGSHLRALLRYQALFEDVVSAIKEIEVSHPRWNRALTAVGDWLYFDQEDAPKEYRERLRSLYDELMPVDDIERILVFSSGWRIDLHDPDVPYDKDGVNSHDYGERMSEKIISLSPKESNFFRPILLAFSEETYNSAGTTTMQIAMHVDDPEKLVNQCFEFTKEPGGANTCQNILCNILRGLNRVDESAARKHLETALQRDELVPYAVNLISSVYMDEALLSLVIELLRSEKISPSSIPTLGLKSELKGAYIDIISNLIEILNSQGSEGAWASLEFLNFLLYGKATISPSEEALIKKSVTLPSLFERAKYGQMDTYYWKEFLNTLFAKDLVDLEFAETCTQFITSLIDVEDYSVQLQFDDHAREILVKLIDAYPEVVWRCYTERLALGDPTIEDRLSSLYGTEFGEPSRAGVLDNMPIEIVESWMLEDRANRLPTVLGWINILNGSGENATWDPEFVSFIEDHVRSVEEMSSIRLRLSTGAWVGSFSSKLEPQLQRIEKLGKMVDNPEVRRWVASERQSLLLEFEWARRQDENRNAGFKA